MSGQSVADFGLRRAAHLSRPLMLAGYEEHPEAITGTVAERGGLPLSWWEARLPESPGSTEMVLGAVHEGEPAGGVGLRLEPFAMAVGSRFVSKVHMWLELESRAAGPAIEEPA
jgi:hypothetical protein